MAYSSVVKIEGDPLAPLPVSGTITSSPSNPVIVQPASSFGAGYIFSIANQAGVVAANNFLSLFNPVGSGKSIFLSGSFVSVVAGAATTSTEPLRGFRITAASAGVLQAGSAVAKLKTSQANSIAEIRQQ
jgi:hypothetical protein